MTLEDAIKLLSGCRRDTLLDYAFGDSEVSWFDGDRFVAEGYFSSRVASVIAADNSWLFSGDDAKRLRETGTPGKFSRNDGEQP